MDLRARNPSRDHALDKCVVVIDDDLETRESLGRLLRSVGLPSMLFANATDFLSVGRLNCASCLVLDVRLPDRSGLDVQRDLLRAGVDMPVVFITGYGDIPMTVQAMKAGAIEFLTKPFRDQDLLDAVIAGLTRDAQRRDNEVALGALKARFKALTPREQAVLVQVIAGRLNKQIASDMGITEATVKVHRCNLMRKLAAGSLAELCHMMDQIDISPSRGGGSIPPLSH